MTVTSSPRTLRVTARHILAGRRLNAAGRGRVDRVDNCAIAFGHIPRLHDVLPLVADSPAAFALIIGDRAPLALARGATPTKASSS